MKYNFSRMEQALSEWELELNDEQKNMFEIYYDMLVEKNKVMNLTAITDFDEVVEKHFLDSLSLVQIENLAEKKKIIDIGTGAGFPGIPLKIMFPDLEVTLADSLKKRILFLQDVIRELGLKDIDAVHGRAEDLSRDPEYRETYDLCVSRAVANLSVLSEYCLPFVSLGGKFIPYKSSDIDSEVSDAKKAVFVLGGEIDEILKFDLIDGSIHRSLIVINKVKKTPKAYPRKAGMPSKNPLR